MKIILINLFVTILLVTVGCKKSEYQIKENSVYISDAAGTAKATTITMENGADINVNVRLAKKMDQDVEVSLKLNPALIQGYNLLNASNYVAITDIQLPAEAKVIIPAGEIGGVYTLRIDDFDTGGKQYALGVELASIIKGGVEISNSQSKFVYLLAKPLIVNVPTFGSSGTNLIQAAEGKGWGISTSQWSLECWTNMSAYRRNNQAIFNTGSNQHEIYIRFGDANSPYNYLQIKTLGGQVQTASDLLANVWYHWAFVYDGKSLTIFKNGEAVTKFDPPAPAGGSVKFDFLQMISSSSSWFIDQCKMSEVRLWKTAITSTQIKSNMFYAIDPTNKDLIGYWPLNKADTVSISGVDYTQFQDLTGNERHLNAGPGILKGWTPNVRFD